MKDKVDELDSNDHELALGMTMVSIRGNWGNVETRLAVVEYLADQLEVEEEDWIRTAIDAYIENDHWDGRRFRGHPVYEAALDADTDDQIRVYEKLVRCLPHELSWDRLLATRER